MLSRLALTFVLFAISLILFGPQLVTAKEMDGDVPLGGISASLQPDLFTGVLTGSIPIDVPSGRNGMQPNLALTYTSSGGNSWTGMGWKLETGSIERQTKWGVLYSPTTQEELDGKVYTMRLNGISGDLVQDTVDPLLYHPKIEGSFARIKKLSADGTAGWEITDTKGTKYKFGTSIATQIQSGSLIFKWCLERVEDRDGNYMTVTYQRDGTTNQNYLDHIDYTGNTATGALPTNTVKFYLESRTDAPVMYTSNFPVTTAKRLKTVATYADLAMTKLVRAYKLTPYSMGSTTSASLLSTIQQYGKDAAVDGVGTVTGGTAGPTITVGPSQGLPVFSGYSQWNSNFGASGWSDQNTYPRILADVNGDGKEDVVGFATNGVDVALSTGSAFTGYSQWNSNFGASGWSNQNTYPRMLTNVNGDGKADVVGFATNGVDVALAGGAVPDLVTSLENGLGWMTTVTYTPSPQHSSTSTPAHPQLPYPVQTVTGLTTNDGNGNSSTTTYSYTSGYHHIGERDFRGFKTAVVTSPGATDADKTVTTTSFHQGNELTPIDTEDPGAANGYMKGKPYRTEVHRKSDNLLYTKTETSYLPDQIGADTSAPWFTPSAVVTTSIYDSAGVLAKQTQTESVTYDVYGNLTLAYNRGDWTNNNAVTSDDTTTAVTFGNADTTNWLVTFPTIQTTYAGLGTTGTKLTETKYFYDGASSCTTPAGTLIPTKGHVTKVERYLDQGGSNPISGMEYNPYGSLTCTRDPLGNKTNLAYDPASMFPLTSTNALGHVTTTTYYGVNGVAMDTGLYGQVKSVTDPNAQTTTSTYDALGRALTTTTPDGLVSTTAYNYGGTFVVGTQNIQRTTSGGGLSANLVSKTYFDGLGRTTKTESPGAADGGGNLKVLVTETQYDVRGLVMQTSLPYIQGTESVTGRWRLMTYDALGRTIDIQQPDNNHSKRCYNAWTATTLDPKLHKKVETKDALGRLVTVQEYTGTQADCTTSSGTLYATTNYAYDLRGNLLSVTDTKGNVSTMAYDTLNRKLTMHDPDMGNWSYTYDANGNLLTQVDAKNQKLCFTYDALNRRTQKNFGTTTVACGTATVVYAYDDTVAANNGKGRLKQVTDPAQSVTFQYDTRGRIKQSAKTLDGTTYTTTIVYDGLGRLTTVNYPTNPIMTVTYTYDGPQLKQVTEGATNYVTYAGWNALGQAATATFANGVVTTMTYANTNNSTCTQQTFRLCTLKTQKGANPLYQDLRYDYENNGNVWNIYDNTVGGNAGDQHFSYDDLDRLTVANGPYGVSGANASFTYTYDEIGNLTKNSQMSANNYVYPASGASSVRPHAVSTAGVNSYTYDANGNLLTGAGRTYTWNPENKPLTIAPPPGSVAAYAFAEGTGTTTADASGNGLTGSLAGATWTSTGKYGNALSFNGTSNYVDLGNPTALQLTGSMTVSAWVYATANPANDGQIIAKSGSSEGWQLKTSPDTGPHTFGVAVSPNATSRTQRYSTTVRSLNTWYHVAGVYNATAQTLDIYVNGVLDNGVLIGTVPAAQYNSTQNVNIGRRPAGYYFNGTIDEVRVYTRALSQAEIQADMTTPVSSGAAIATTFVYDGDGGRVKKIVGSTTTRYLSKLYECDNTNCSRFIWAGSTRIATIASNGTATYWHGDHLGSSNVITDSTGLKVQAATYYPYGNTRTNQSFTTPAVDVPYKYTGKELDSTGIYYCEARYYDPALARFISPDTIVPNPRDPQSFNRYSYVRNNPILYTDPTGHSFLGSIGKFFSRLSRDITKSLVGRIAGWAICPMCMQYVDQATQRYAIAGTAAMGAGYVGGLAASAFLEPFVVGAMGPMMPSVGILAAGSGIGGAAGGMAGGAIGAGGSLLTGQQADLGRAILAGGAGGALSGIVGPIGNPFLYIAGHGLAGGVSSAIQGGDFARGFAFAAVPAAANQAYLGLTGFSTIHPGPGGEARVKAVDAVEGPNSIGTAIGTGGSCVEGSTCSKMINLVPFANAAAGFHDFLTGNAMLGFSHATNYPTMLPSYALAVVGAIDGVKLGITDYSLNELVPQ